MILMRSRALGRGGRPDIAFRHTTPFVPFSGRRESAARRRLGSDAALRQRENKDLIRLASSAPSPAGEGFASQPTQATRQ